MPPRRHAWNSEHTANRIYAAGTLDPAGCLNHPRPRKDGYAYAEVYGFPDRTPNKCRASNQVPVHIWAWTLREGRPPKPGHQLHHTCHNRACFTVEHLQEVTAHDHGAYHRSQQLDQVDQVEPEPYDEFTDPVNEYF